MKVELSSQTKAKYPGFQIITFTIQTIGSKRFELTDNKKTDIIDHYDLSIHNTTLMTDFYNQIGSDRKCHVETLLKAFKDKQRFKSINYLVDLIYYLELTTGLLMGIHDLNYIDNNIKAFLASGSDSFNHISGKIIYPFKGAILLKDNRKIFASLTDGPDDLTKVTNATTDAIVLIFIPPKMTDNILNLNLEYIKNILAADDIKNINYL